MPDHNITLTTRDRVRLEFLCAESYSVLGAAEAAGYFLPAMCHEGKCGLCHARVTQGKYTLSSHIETALTDTAPGAVLLCCCIPAEDLSVELPYKDAQISRHKTPERQAVIESLTPAWAGAMSLTLKLQPDPEFGVAADFSPGQYMELTIPGTNVRRAYSLANLPNWEGRLEFLIRIQPHGKFSTWLSQSAKVGDVLTVRGPEGNFILDETSTRPRCFVGHGCGVAPILSMLRHLGEFQDSQPAQLIFAANTEAELMPKAELDALQSALPQLGITLAVSHPQDGWNGFRGTTVEALSAYLTKNGEPPDIYACGSPKMLEGVEAFAESKGLADHLFHERL